jgi:VWFA-related protein
LLAFFLVLLSLPLAAQSVRDSVTIEVVDVPVFVTSNGQPVRDLTAGDFELYVNGKPQAIEYFDVIGGSERESGPSLRERRLFLLIFDLAFSPPFALGRAQRAAGELIARSPSEDLFAIATYSSSKGVWFATPFTSDRVALARGIASLSTSRSGDPLSIVMTASERAALDDWVRLTPDRGEALIREGLLDRMASSAVQDMYQMQLRRAVEDQVLSLKDLAGRLAALQGQKHVVVLSEGFDGATSGRDALAMTRLSNAGGAMSGGRPLFDFGLIFRSIQGMSEAFQSADILLHALDLKGVHTFAGSESLHVLANETGGRFVHNRNDLGDALVDLTDSFRSGYVLGFKPAGARAKHNTIEVRVKGLDRNAQVKYRKGFTGTPRSFDVKEGLYLADVVLNDVPQTGTAAELRLDGGKLQVKVPLRPLAAQLGKTGTAELLIYLFGEDGVALGFHRQTIQVTADASGEKSFTFAMPEGAKVAKALLRVDHSLGFSRTGAG